MLSLIELPTDECRRLLRVGSIGRLAIVDTDGEILLLPLNYAVVDDAVVIRTFAGSRLAGELWGARRTAAPRAAFEVDLIDHEKWRGWSVVAHGTLAPVDVADLTGHRLPRPWASGERDLFARMTVATIAGRRLGTGWDSEAAMPARVVPFDELGDDEN